MRLVPAAEPPSRGLLFSSPALFFSRQKVCSYRKSSNFNRTPHTATKEQGRNDGMEYSSVCSTKTRVANDGREPTNHSGEDPRFLYVRCKGRSSYNTTNARGGTGRGPSLFRSLPYQHRQPPVSLPQPLSGTCARPGTRLQRGKRPASGPRSSAALGCLMCAGSGKNGGDTAAEGQARPFLHPFTPGAPRCTPGLGAYRSRSFGRPRGSRLEQKCLAMLPTEPTAGRAREYACLLQRAGRVG